MAEQPPPQTGTGLPMWEAVIADLEQNRYFVNCRSLLIKSMRERDVVGRQRYGVPLRAGNGRDALRDAFEESLDLCVYLAQEMEERRRTSKPTAFVEEQHRLALTVAGNLRSLLKERDGK